MRDARSSQTVRPQALALGVLVDAEPSAAMRLAPTQSPAAALALHAALVGDTLSMLSLVPMRHRVALVTPEAAVAAYSERASSGFSVLPQRGASRTARLRSAFQDLFALGAEAAVVVSGACPLLPIGEAFDAVLTVPGRARAVLGPTPEGGVYFVALSRQASALFDGDDAGPHDPSFESLRANAERAGLEVVALPERYEVLGPADLERLGRDAAAAGPGAAPGTLRLLAGAR